MSILKLIPFALFATLLLSGHALAEQKKIFDCPDGSEYVLHYIAFTITFLEPEIAKQYELVRSKAMGVINISVIQRQSDGSTKAVPAVVQGKVTNEIQQQQFLAFKQVIEGPAIYYLAQTQFSEGKNLRFDLEVFPQGQTEPLIHRFTHAFFNN